MCSKVETDRRSLPQDKHNNTLMQLYSVRERCNILKLPISKKNYFYLSKLFKQVSLHERNVPH